MTYGYGAFLLGILTGALISAGIYVGLAAWPSLWSLLGFLGVGALMVGVVALLAGGPPRCS